MSRSGASRRANDAGAEAPELYLSTLARAAAGRRRKPRTPLSRADALAEAPWDDESMPRGWERAFRQAYADRLIERGFALESSTGRSGPSGEHVLPRRKVSATPGEFAAMDRAAEREGLSFAQWARRALVRIAGP